MYRFFFYSLLYLFLSFEVGAAESVRLAKRTAAYSLQEPAKLRGYFPAGADLMVVGKISSSMVQVKYTSPSGKVTEAGCFAAELGVDASPIVSAASGKGWHEVDSSAMELDGLRERGRKALRLPSVKWRHAQTEHFVIHFERSIFAEKVARMAEFFYHYISADLGGAKDHVKHRSHIFIFRNTKKWNAFQKSAGLGVGSWAFAFVEGPAMYLQQAQDTQSSSSILAHEMTHLVLNRFFRRQPPVWLNEGMAEWYGEFARAEFKGVGKSKRAPFNRLKNPYQFRSLLNEGQYPTERAEVRSFYDTSKFLVGYLRLEFPEDNFQSFIHDMLDHGDADEAIRKHFSFADDASFEKGFKAFANIR